MQALYAQLLVGLINGSFYALLSLGLAVIFGKGSIRADGRKIHPAYLFEVKKPEESKAPWDYYKLIATISPEDAARPLEASECPLVKK